MNNKNDSISNVQDSIKAIEDQLQTKEIAVLLREQQLEELGADLDERHQQIIAKESAVEIRARNIAQREIEADAGFSAKNREALAALAEAHAALRSEVDHIQGELDAARLKGIEKLEKWLLDERRTRMAALDAELQSDRERHRTKLAAEVKAHDESLDKLRARFDEDQRAVIEVMAQQREVLQVQEKELHHKLKELEWKEADIDGEKAGLERSIEARARDQVSSLQRQLDVLRDEYSRRNETIISLESRLRASEDLLSRFGDDPAEIERRIDRQEQKIASLEHELLSRPSASDKERLVALLEQERSWSSERDRLVRENTQFKADQSRWLTGVAELEQQRERREVAERRLDVLAGEIEKYRDDVDRMRALYEQPEKLAKRVEGIELPIKEFLDRKRLDGSPPKELDWLEGINKGAELSGMQFPKRLLHAFHTSLKSAELSPLTVLAGVSGTGKSALPRLYSRFGGLNCLSLAVQPNWDSPQSLFGFFNSIDGRFNATPVLRALVQAQHAPDHDTYEHGLSDRLMLILLDEMNLAHVEQYFSDLLSKLEDRRGESRDVTLDIDIGAGADPYRLVLGRNVLWVGTMNEDETTKSLSDKVIDRSNLLYFPRPRTLHSRTEVALHDELPLIDASVWQGWQQLRSPFMASEIEAFKHGLEEINQRLEFVGRALGHRVWQSVEYYMANHPEVIEARERNDQDALQRTMRRAYEDQLVLKVMPKLRGIETSGDDRRNCLDPIKQLLKNNDLGLSLSEDFEIACRVGHGAFIWNSARYLEMNE